MRVLFVCTGNICRSPTAEGVLRKIVSDAGMNQQIIVDSAGTHGSHQGHPPDSRAQSAAKSRGYDLSKLKARKLAADDFEHFDLLLAMDEGHFSIMQRIAPPGTRDKVKMFLSYARNTGGPTAMEVPDPYYGAPGGFERVLDLIEDAANGLFASIQRDPTFPT